jgi:hypothetical protein
MLQSKRVRKKLSQASKTATLAVNNHVIALPVNAQRSHPANGQGRAGTRKKKKAGKNFVKLAVTRFLPLAGSGR